MNITLGKYLLFLPANAFGDVSSSGTSGAGGAFPFLLEEETTLASSSTGGGLEAPGSGGAEMRKVGSLSSTIFRGSSTTSLCLFYDERAGGV